MTALAGLELCWLNAPHAATLDRLGHLFAKGSPIATLESVFPTFDSLAGTAGPCVTAPRALHPGQRAGGLADGIATLHLVEVSDGFPTTLRLFITEISRVSALAVTVSVPPVRYLTPAVFAGQTMTGVKQLPLLVTQGAVVTIHTLTVVRLLVERNTLSMNALVSLAGVGGWLVAVWPTPARLAVAHWSMGTIGLAYAMQAVDLSAGFTAWHHPWLHLRLSEVLQLVVDI